jgi:hypothetical protein
MTITEDRTMRRILVIAALLAGTAVHAQTYTDVWNDVGKRRNLEMDYALNVDSTACDREAGLQKGRPSAKYRKCMGAHGWTYSHLIINRAPSYSSDSASPNSAADAEQSRINQQNADEISRRIDDDVRHDDEMNATIDAANAAAAAVSSGN